jgi:hypothetical protein
MTPPQPDDPNGLLAEMDALRRYVAIKVNEASPAYGSGNVYEASSSIKLTNWLLTVAGLLLVAGIVGEVNLYAKVEAIQSTMQLIVDGKIVIVRVP